MDSNEQAGGFEHALAMAPACELDPAGRQAQKARYRTIGKSVTAVRSGQHAVLIAFGEGVDTAAMQEVIAVERGCCPFLGFEFDGTAHTLTVTVLDPAMRPALDAIATAFEGALR